MASRRRCPAGKACAMAFRPSVTATGTPGNERRRLLVALAVGEIEEAAGHECRRAVGCDVAQAGGHECEWTIRADEHMDSRHAEDLHRLAQGLAVEAQRAAVLASLVGGRVDRATEAEPIAPVLTRLERARDRTGLIRRRRLISETPGASHQDAGLPPARRPVALADPAARADPAGGMRTTESCIQARSSGSSMIPVCSCFSQ